VPLLIGGWSVHALLFVALALVGEAILLWPIAVLLGLYMAATEGAERALIADLVTPNSLGSAYGWYYLVKGLLLLPASAVFGLIWHGAGASAAFLSAASVVALASAAHAVGSAFRAHYTHAETGQIRRNSVKASMPTAIASTARRVSSKTATVARLAASFGLAGSSAIVAGSSMSSGAISATSAQAGA
jgi:hypothetical protein